MPQSAAMVPSNNLNDGYPHVVLTDQTNLLPFRKVILVFFGLALCVFVSSLDAVMEATVLPNISSTFNAGSVIYWVPSAYLLTSTSFQPLYGRLSDIFGRKAALCTAMTLLAMGNLAAGFSRNVVELIVFRGFAGTGGGGILSMAQIVISDVVSLRERGKYHGIILATMAIGYAVGPVIGGIFAQKVTWRWCFWITTPISFFSMCVVIFVLPLKQVQGDMRRKLLAIDYVGATLTLAGCALVILPLIWGGVTFPWGSAVVLAPLLSGLVVIVLFCYWEYRGARLPIVPMYIFNDLTVTGVLITTFINGFITFSSLYYLPQFFQIGLRFSPIRAGIFVVPVMVSQMVASWIAGVIVSRTGRYRNIIHLGFSIWAIGCGCISTITPSSHKPLLVLYMLLAGMGGGQTIQTTIVAAQATVPRKDMSVVTALRNFIRLLGGTLSLGIGSTIINNSLRASMTSMALPPSVVTNVVNDPLSLATPSKIGLSSSTASFILNHGYTKGFKSAFILNAALAAAATLTSFVMIRHKDLMRGDEEQLRKAAIETREGEELQVRNEPATQ